MKQDYSEQLESRIDRELKELPELPAPPTLLARVMAAIQQQAHLPWYRRSWQMWPLGLQVISLVLLLAVFAGICFAGWKLPQSPEVTTAVHKADGWLAGVGFVWNTINVVLGAAVLAMKQLGSGFLIGCLAALALGYATCVGLGTLYLRIGFARRG